MQSKIILVILLMLFFMNLYSGNAASAVREELDWEWKTPPQTLLENYYDYFQCLNDTPAAVHQNQDGGVSIVYRAKDENGLSELYYSFINGDGEVEITDNLGITGFYPDAEVWQEYGQLFACWHGLLEQDYANYVNYDLYDLHGMHNMWKETPLMVFHPDSTGIFPNEDDVFIWPQIKTGPSPTINMQRIYCLAKNYTESTGNVSLPAPNYLVCYADFDIEDLNMQHDLEWHYTSIPQLDGFHNEDPFWANSYKSWTVIDDMVIVMGYLSRDTDEYPEIFCLVNESYGEGDWDYYSQPWVFDIPNTQYYAPGSSIPSYMFGAGTTPFSMILNSTNFNLVPIADNSKVTFGCAMAIMMGDESYWYYYPEAMMIYPKSVNFDLQTHSFGFCDIYPQGLDASDDTIMIPWDLNEDGEVDDFDEEGYPFYEKCLPYIYDDPEIFFHYNQFYMTSNPQMGWLAYIWLDGSNLYLNDQGIAGYESWAEMPEIAIAFSEDNGETWYNPVYLNANPESDNYCPQMSGMIPGYVYPGDYIEAGEDGAAILHLFFIDDYSYGCYHNGNYGENAGAAFEYAAIKINSTSQMQKTDLPTSSIVSRNYPNPFNPCTTIEFELTQSVRTVVAIYNLKGQKVETLASRYFPAGKNHLYWEAANYASGIYYYQIKTEQDIITHKMLLIK